MGRIIRVFLVVFGLAVCSTRCAAQGDDYYYVLGPGLTFTGTQLNAATKGSNVTLSNFNLTALVASGTGSAVSTVSHTGAGYFEINYSAGTTYCVGICNSSFVTSANAAGTTNSWVYVTFSGSGFKQNGTSGVGYGATWATGDVISGYIDGSGNLTFYKNGTSQGTAYTGLSGAMYVVVGTYSSFTFTATVAFAAPWDSRTATLRTTLGIGTTGW